MYRNTLVPSAFAIILTIIMYNETMSGVGTSKNFGRQVRRSDYGMVELDTDRNIDSPGRCFYHDEAQKIEYS
jgi:hypothetical protein